MPPKSGKKGKGGPQIAPGTKGKSAKAVPMDASDSEDDSGDMGSSSEDETPTAGKVKTIPSVKKAQAPAKKQESGEDSDDSISESDEDKTPVNAVQVKQAQKKAVDESDEEEEESEEEDEKPMVGQKRKLPQLDIQPPKKATKGNNKQKPEKNSEDEEESDEEENSEESEESEEEPVVDLKKQKPVQQTQKNKSNVNGKRAQKKAAEEEDSEDEEDSDEESEEEESDVEEEDEEEVEEKTKGKEGKKKNKESAKALPDGEVVTLFCGNIKDNCEPKELGKFFKKNGLKVADVRKPVGKRFAYVDLADASDLKAALALNQSSFQDQEIKVEQAKKRLDTTGTPKTPNAAKDRFEKDDKDCTLFVKNLADSVTEETLRELFSEAAQIRIPKSSNGAHKGFAYIEFKDAGVVEKMIKKHQGAELEGQALYLDHVGQKSSFKSPQANKSSGEPGKSKVLFVKNLSYSVTEDKLVDTFEGAVSARIPTFPDTGKPKGFAFIDFESADAAQEAYDKCQGQDLDGREMRVDFALDKGDRGGRSPGGNFGGRGRGGGGGRGNFRGGRGGRGGGGGNWDRGGRGGRGGGRGGGGDRGFGDKRRSFDSGGSSKSKKVKLDSDSD